MKTRMSDTFHKMLFVMLLIIFTIMFFNCYAIDRQSTSKDAVDKFIASFRELERGRVESYFIDCGSYTKVKMPEDDTDHHIHMMWNHPELFGFVDALKKFDFEKGEYDDISKFSLHFYDRNGNKILQVYLAHRHPAVVINGEAFKPTPALMQSMRHFMPYLAYWQISHSPRYEKYFEETRKSDPNSI